MSNSTVTGREEVKGLGLCPQSTGQEPFTEVNLGSISLLPTPLSSPCLPHEIFQGNVVLQENRAPSHSLMALRSDTDGTSVPALLCAGAWVALAELSHLP